MKSYTDIEQSKILSKILPQESADMYYPWDIDSKSFLNIPIIKDDSYYVQGSIPCWSLTALLSVLPMIRKGDDTANPFITKTPDDEYYIVYATLTKEVDTSLIYDNPIDACVEMVIKLHELNLL